MNRRRRVTGILPGPRLIGNVPGSEDSYILPNGVRGVIKDSRVCFTYFVDGYCVHVHADLDSDHGLMKSWPGKPEKALGKARKALARYGSQVGVSVLISDGWSSDA